MSTREQDEWICDAFGVDPGNPQHVEHEPGAVIAVGGRMQPDCVVVRGKVPGPIAHVLCGTHHHVLDTDKGVVIAADLKDYTRKFPRPHAPSAHPSTAGHHASAKAPAPTAPAPTAPAPTAPAATSPAPPAAGEKDTAQAVRIPIPAATGNDRADVVAQMSVLDTIKPVENDPLHCTAMIGGQVITLPKAEVDKVRLGATKRMQFAMQKINDLCEVAEDDYANQKKINDDQSIVSGGVRAFKWIASLGKVHDPKDDIDGLVGNARRFLTAAGGMMGGGVFGMPAGMIADAETCALQAGKVARVWSNALVDGASAMLPVLEHTRNISFGVLAGLAAVGTGGAAGMVAAAVIPTGADVLGKGLAGEKINWAGAVIDVTIGLVAGKFGGAAEKAIGEAVAAQVAKRLEGRLAGVAIDKLADKVGEKVAKKVVDKGSDVLKSVAKSVAAKFHNKDMTYEEMAKEVIKELGDPNAKEGAKVQSLMESLLKDAVASPAA